MTTPEFVPLTPIVKVEKKENGKLFIKTNTHIIDNVDTSDLRYIAYPYAGKSLSVEVHCEDPELRQRVCNEFDKATDLYPYFDPELPVAANCFENLRLVYENKGAYKSLRSLEKCCENSSILFIGAGPSTEANIEVIKEIVEKNKAIVIAGGSANRILSKHKIYPHFGLAFDPRIEEYTEVFKHISHDYLENVPFITNQTLFPRCLNMIQEAYVGCSSSLTDLNAFLEPEEVILPEGRIGVSTMIPYLADYMGAKDLYLIGVDLCFTKDGKRYSDIESSVEDNDKQDYKGKLTRTAWIRESHDIVESSSKVAPKVINCSQESLLVEVGGINTQSLATLLANNEHKLRYKILDKEQSLKQVQDKMSKLHSQLLDFVLDLDPIIEGKVGKDNDALRCLLYTYHVLQQLREIRTGDYNEALIRQVISNMELYVRRGISCPYGDPKKEPDE